MTSTTLLTGVNDPTVLGQQFPVDHPYAKGKIINNGATTLAASGVAVADLATAGFTTLVVSFRLGNATTPATASGDITAGVTPYEDDGVTLPNGGTTTTAILTPDVVLRAATLQTNVAFYIARYVLGGMDKVKVSILNNNAVALQGATATYFLQK